VPGYELTDTAEGTERTRSCYDITVIQQSVERPSAIPAVRCTPIKPKQDRFHVPIDSIASVTAIGGQPTDILLSYEQTAQEEARFLCRLARDNPRAVDVASLVSLLEDDSDEPRIEALRALAIVAKASTRECTAALPILESLLESGELSTPAPALATIATIAGDYPGEVAPLVDAITPYLGSEEDVERVEAARCMMEVAEEEPPDVVDAVPMLATIVEDQEAGQEYAVYTLTCLSREFPEAITPVAGALSHAVTNEDLDDGIRLNATAALGRVVGEYPDIAVTIVDDVADLFDATNQKLRNNAIGLVGDVAQVHTDVVEPHVDAIAVLLTSDDTYARINASGCLSRVAEDFPDSVSQYVDQFIELLTDDHPVVRKNACGALGHLGAEEAEMELVERASQDENEAVRERAEWALHRIQR
jgi:HEAT repeat protein